MDDTTPVPQRHAPRCRVRGPTRRRRAPSRARVSPLRRHFPVCGRHEICSKRAVRSVFFGTPQIAVPALRALHASSELVGVVCQPDRPKGRGLQVQAPEVKQAALQLGVEVHQPVKVRDGALERWLRERSVDVAIVLAYGRILPDGVLNAPRHGCLNLHASLLPHYRGAAPIQWAIANGESITGVTTMRIDAGLDTGEILLARSCPILPGETAVELSERLAPLGGDLLVETFAGLESGTVKPVPQDHTAATLAPILKKEDGLIDWHSPAAAIVNRILTPSVLADLPGLTIALRNLVENAVRFSPSGSIVMLSAAAVEGQVSIRVQDNGRGIPEDVLPHLFRIDHHHATPGADGEVGSGLGLLIAKALVERMGGTVHLYSKAGGGTAVTITLTEGAPCVPRPA